jgi:hypothetical protein
VLILLQEYLYGYTSIFIILNTVWTQLILVVFFFTRNMCVDRSVRSMFNFSSRSCKFFVYFMQCYSLQMCEQRDDDDNDDNNVT